jgi:surface antigen
VLSRPGWVVEGYRKEAASRNRRARAQFAFLSLAIALLASGCSLTMNLTGFSGEEETTASLAPQASVFPVPLDDEDWRRVNAALALAVDPQGAGLPVNWDNPSSKKRGSFEQSGTLAIVGHTLCRPFKAKLVDGLKESLHVGQACRTGPGEWAMRDVKPAGMVASGKDGDQKLPPAVPAILHSPPKRD